MKTYINHAVSSLTALALVAGSIMPIGVSAHGVGATLNFNATASPPSTVNLSWTSTSDTGNPSIDQHNLTIWFCSGVGCDLSAGTSIYSYTGNNFTTDTTGLSSGTIYSGSFAHTGLASGTYSYKIQEKHGGFLIEQTQTNIVVNPPSDTTAPVIAPHADVTEEATSAAGASVTYTAPTATDNVDAPFAATCAPASGSVFALGHTTVTCNATDTAGNVATPVTFDVHATDTTPPVITLTGSATINLTVGNTYTELGATTADAVDGSGSATPSGSVNTGVAGTYTITYSATDAAGNVATPVTRTVVVSSPAMTSTVTTITNAASLTGTPTTAGQQYTIDWSVAPVGTGTVTVSVNSVVVCTTAVGTGTGSCNYTPAAAGTDNITVSYSGDSSFNPSAANTTHQVDAAPSGGNNAPVANSLSVSTNGNVAVSGNVTGSDADSDPLTFATSTNPTNGTLVFNSNGSFTYTPNSGFNGSDSFTFVAHDGTANSNTATVSITVNAAASSGGGGGGGNSTSGSRPAGQVLGAFSGEVLGGSCGLYMDRYMKLGGKNDEIQVIKLQAFLNTQGFFNRIPTGVFDMRTANAVKDFQEKHADHVLKPWNLTQPTGLVYLTTLHQINMIQCPELTLTLPPLVPWTSSTNTTLKP